MRPKIWESPIIGVYEFNSKIALTQRKITVVCAEVTWYILQLDNMSFSYIFDIFNFVRKHRVRYLKSLLDSYDYCCLFYLSWRSEEVIQPQIYDIETGQKLDSFSLRLSPQLARLFSCVRPLYYMSTVSQSSLRLLGALWNKFLFFP